MATKELGQVYDSLPEQVRTAMLALSVLIERIGSLPKTDRDELFELVQEWRKASEPEEQRSIRRAMEEIIALIPANARTIHFSDEKTPLQGERKAWAEYVGKRIKELRELSRFTQVQLAQAAGLPQSHISRLENAEYSATSMTLEKIAKALDVSVGEIRYTKGRNVSLAHLTGIIRTRACKTGA